MKIIQYSVQNVPPIKHFKIAGLTDVVVFAGPNGVGKTTLLNHLLQIFRNPWGDQNASVTVAATHPEEISIWGGREVLDTTNMSEAQILRSFLQRPTKRGLLKGGVLNFDSARAFDQIQPYTWSWSFNDPFDENIGWDYSFNPTKGRFQDVIHALIRKVRSQKEAIAKQAIELRNAGAASLELGQFADPLKRFKDAFSQLLPGKMMLDIDEQTQNIEYQQAEKRLHFRSLSSGEREVVTVLFDFLLRNPQDCVIVFDEPELHLHPELSYRMLRTLQDAGERNQFIFCTHSPEIITASLEQTVVFISPARGEGANQALKVQEDDDAASVMRALGQSVGVISLGKKIVMIEGERNSLDKEVYGAIVGSRYPELVLVPVGGKDSIASFQSAMEKVLSKTIWGVDFFMICDGDSVARGAQGIKEISRIRYLSRYHLENYFLDENTWAAVFKDDLILAAANPACNPVTIREELRTLARDYVSYAVSLRVANFFRTQFGNVDLMPKGVDGADVDTLLTKVEIKRNSELTRCSECLEPSLVEETCRKEYRRIIDAVGSDHEDWKTLIPGRPILKRFAAKTGQDYSTLKRLYIRAAAKIQPNPFAEIETIFSEFQSQ
jgi:energy-coupling factor transporter ATP-binding protein EcfA2